MKRRALIIAAALAITAPAVDANDSLQPERIPNKARELAAKGRRHHQAGDYAAAITAFKEAYVLAPSAGLLFNIAQAYRLGGKCDEAAWMYRRFLETGPTGVQRQLTETHLDAVEKCGSGGLRVTITPPAIDARIPEPTPAVELQDRPSGPPARSKLKRAGTYTVVGGGVALVGAAVFALDARRAQATVEETYRNGGKWHDVKDVHARGKRSASLATVLGVGGGVAAIAGSVMYGLGRHHERRRQVAITPTSGGAQVSLSWGF